MQKLSLNFYGEQVSIQCPKDFDSLKKEAQKYQLNLFDILEIDISYIKNETKKLIKSEVYSKPPFIQESQILIQIKLVKPIIPKKFIGVQNKSKNVLAQLEILKKIKEENKTKRKQMI